MIHLKCKCKINFVKLPLIWIDLCLNLVFKNVTAGRNTGCRSVVNCASQVAKIMPARQTISHQVQYITRQLVRQDAVHTRACTRIKKFPELRNRPKSDTCLYGLFLSQRPRKSPPAVMSTSRETPCIQAHNFNQKPVKSCTFGTTTNVCLLWPVSLLYVLKRCWCYLPED